MKFNKTLICLIICLALISQMTARKHRQTQKKSKTLAYQQIWGDWNKAVVEVFGVNSYKFSCKLRDVVDQNKNPIGVEFDALEQLSQNDKTGFIPFGQALTQMTNQDIPRSMIDYRQVTNCLFTDNAKEKFGAWRLEFDFNFNEEYGVKSQSEKSFGNSLRIKVTFPNANKNQAQKLKQDLNTNCLLRNKQVTGLKKAATDAGNVYHALWFEYNNRQQSLEDQAKLINDQKQVVEQVRQEEAVKAQAFAVQVQQNEQLLLNSLSLLNQTAQSKQTNEQETEKISENLQVIRSNLLNLETSQSLVKNNIEKSKTALNAAIQLQQEQEAKKTTIEQNKQALANQTLVEQREYERLLKEIEERQKRMQQEYNLKKQKLQEQANLLNNQSSQVSEAIAAQQRSVEGLKVAIQQQLEQVKSIDEQCSVVRKSINSLQEQIDKKRNISAQLNQQIKQQQQEIKDRESRVQQIKEDNARQLALLKQKELDQINLIKDLDAKQKEKLVYFANQAHQEITKAEGNFTAALEAIVRTASKASHRTTRAAQLVLQKGHVTEIAAIVSSTDFNIKTSLMRQAKKQRQYNRLAKLRNNQIQQVRMQRNKLRNKLRHRLHSKKY